ncbi:MAG: Gfo/Idh/MocA family oxidoreductase [Verrucomicrobiae bacterium]|nr:Gfo/Idh/MocA family oxidoreductase [Verrucomicrobiae bacterium]
MKMQTSRRRFLTKLTQTAAGMVLFSRADPAWCRPHRRKLNIAVAGVGRRGTDLLRYIRDIGENVIAVCDADRRRLDEAAQQAPDARKFQDFRQMLREMDRQLDAVVVATPDHTHAVIAARAMKRGKHVYVEKPLAHTVAEARALRLIAKQQKVATQMGNQGMASNSFRRALELIQDGALGEIREAHVWFDFGGSGPTERPMGQTPVPDYLDWDLWLGPAPFRPFHPGYLNWWRWRDFSTGIVGGGGSHSINLAFKALNLAALWEDDTQKRIIRVETKISERCPHTFPRWQIAHFDIPPRNSTPPAQIHWYNGTDQELKRQGIWELLERIAGRSLVWKDGSWAERSGSLIVGSKGVAHTNAHNSVCVLLPAKDFTNAAAPPQRLPRVRSHFEEWLDACRGGQTPFSNFDHSGPAMELLLLANVASLVDESLEFDPVTCKILNNGEADRALHPPRRAGWEL